MSLMSLRPVMPSSPSATGPRLRFRARSRPEFRAGAPGAAQPNAVRCRSYRPPVSQAEVGDRAKVAVMLGLRLRPWIRAEAGRPRAVAPFRLLDEALMDPHARGDSADPGQAVDEGLEQASVRVGAQVRDLSAAERDPHGADRGPQIIAVVHIARLEARREHAQEAGAEDD